MFRSCFIKYIQSLHLQMTELIEDYTDKRFVKQNSTILETLMWPKYRHIIYFQLIIIPIFILKANIDDNNYNSYPDTICLYCFVISLIISATFEKLLQKLKLSLDRVLLIKSMILLADLTSGAFAAEIEIRLKQDVYYRQSIIQLLFFVAIVRNLKVRFYMIAKFLIYRGIRNEVSFFNSAVAYHNIFLIVMLLRCIDIQLIELTKIKHFCEQSFKSVPSAVCILSSKCDNVLFKNSFMKKMVSSKYREQTLTIGRRYSKPQDLTQMKSDMQIVAESIKDDRVLDFISHLYISFDDAKSQIPSLDLKQHKQLVEDNLLNSEEVLLNLEYLLQQITISDKKTQGEIYNFQCFFSQDDDIRSIEKNESRLKVVIEVRIKTQLQYGDARGAILINFYDISTHLKTVYYKKMNLFKSKVIKSISHELRTRLNVIQGMVQILQTDVQFDDKTQKILRTTFNNCRIQKYIIESIINYNLLMESNIPLKKEKCKINDIVTDVISLFSEEAEEKETKIQFYQDKNDQNQYELDADKIKSVLIHILSNSIRHTKKGQIMIRVHKDVSLSALLKSSKSKPYSIISLKLQRNSELSAKFSVQGSNRGKRLTVERHSKYGMDLASQFSAIGGIYSNSGNESYLQIEIKDNGTGIEPGKLEFIQEMLLDDDQGNDAQFSDIASGAMIGLRASNQIARYLNNIPEDYSCIRIESNQLSGTTVTLTLKLKSVGSDTAVHADFQPTSLIESEAPLQPIQRMIHLPLSSPYMENQPLIPRAQISQRDNNICHCEQDILIVDDEPYNLIVLESLLRKLNQQVIKADDGKHAIEIMVKRFDEGKIHKCRSIRAIIMDYQMPIINGEKAAKQILQICNERGLAPVPIFGLTGFSGEDDIQRLLQAGMVDVYIKPITMATLEEILSKLQRSEFKSGDFMNSNISQAFQCIEAEYEDVESFGN